VDEMARIKARKHSVNTHVGLFQRKLQALFKDVVDAYVFFNPNGDQGITKQELRRGLCLVRESDAGVEELMWSMDSRCRDGFIDAQEFCRHVSWTNIDDLNVRLGRAQRRSGQITHDAMSKLPSVLAALESEGASETEPEPGGKRLLGALGALAIELPHGAIIEPLSPKLGAARTGSGERDGGGEEHLDEGDSLWSGDLSFMR
jgi:hypothetical protein